MPVCLLHRARRSERLPASWGAQRSSTWPASCSPPPEPGGTGRGSSVSWCGWACAPCRGPRAPLTTAGP